MEKVEIVVFSLLIAFLAIDYFKRKNLNSLLTVMFLLITILFRMYDIKFGQTIVRSILFVIWLIFGLFILLSSLSSFKKRQNEFKEEKSKNKNTK